MEIQKTVLYDPTSETDSLQRTRLSPPETLKGKTVALFDIGKWRSDEFLSTLKKLLTDRGITTRLYSKPTNARVAPVEVLQAMATETDVAVMALAD